MDSRTEMQIHNIIRYLDVALMHLELGEISGSYIWEYYIKEVLHELDA